MGRPRGGGPPQLPDGAVIAPRGGMTFGASVYGGITFQRSNPREGVGRCMRPYVTGPN